MLLQRVGNIDTYMDQRNIGIGSQTYIICTSIEYRTEQQRAFLICQSVVGIPNADLCILHFSSGFMYCYESDVSTGANGCNLA